MLEELGLITGRPSAAGVFDEAFSVSVSVEGLELARFLASSCNFADLVPFRRHCTHVNGAADLSLRYSCA